MTLTERVRNFLLARGDSQNKIHKATGLARATVANFLKGDEVHSDTLDKLVEYTGAKIELPPLPKEPTKKRPSK